MRKFAELWTQAGRALSGDPWQEYPRPSLRRDSYLNLNGMWEFAAGDAARFPERYDRTIRVPFPPESLLSGVHEQFPEERALYYRRRFLLPAGFVRRRVLLHFGAADQIAEVWLNGAALGAHTGGYEPFTFDVTDALQEENVLLVRVTDRLETHVLPYGKQRRRRGGMWYTSVSGLWQTVWLESVPEEYVRAVRAETEGNRVCLFAEGVQEGVVRVRTPQGVLEQPFTGGCAALTLQAPRLWSPEDPYLYETEIETAQDRVQTYFALRTLEIRTENGQPRLCLNGKPYFFHGVLDQGYWSDGLFTPASPACFEDDILAMKRLGFNTLRKHIKVEPELFYYACDRLGIVVFQDMVNNGRYSFLSDTALPTLGLKSRNDRRMHRDAETRRQFRRSMEQTVRRLRKHPCVCLWTIFNEGWGQFDGQAQYEALRELDDTRFIDTASGWFRCGESDVESLHIYFRPVRLPRSERPLVLSEFGGYSCKPEGHVFNTEKTFGYRFFKEQESYMDALERLYLEQILPAREKGLCAAIYTQLSDVEDETNGLLSYDRAVCKADEGRMRAVAQRLCSEIFP